MPSGNNKRIVKNTLFLYLRMLFILGVSLYTSRVVLATLGVEDFGIYNVIGGIVVMFTFLNAGMVQTSQRFLAFEIGRNNPSQLKNVFATTLTIHFLLAIIFFISAEIIGLWFLNTKINIDSDRMVAANWVFQCSILAFLINIVSVPYNAAVVAREHMHIYAYISIIEVVLKLLIVFLTKYSIYDKLIIYAILQLSTAIIIRIIYGIYCHKKFEECRTKLLYIKNLFREIMSFASWNFVANIGFIFKDQGVNVLINMFHGVTINAARGIAYQVSGVVNGFVSNFQMAITPQITKRYAANEIESMLDITFKGSKYSFFLLYIIALPVIFKAPYILQVWLETVPEYTIIFLRLALIVSLIDCTAIPLGKAINSTGKIKAFLITITCILLTDIPISYIILQKGFAVYSVMYIAILTSLLSLFARLFILKKHLKQVSVYKYLTDVLLRCLIFVGISFSFIYCIRDSFDNTIIGLITICCISLLINIILIYFIGIQYEERKFVIEKSKWIIEKIKIAKII